ncbi:MAG TPA: 5-formyltetrahydrofolate cyclo-ligase, partial [Burkholderiales bacterium]|nr:5-formyltetrahydrofolate cyclo-ligase [Burkholderiales bacterium]
WRKARRAELISVRTAIAPDQRRDWSERITTLLEAGFGAPAEAVVGFCWPYKGEFDARFAVRHWRERGAIAALPEVVEKARPMQFRKWWPGAPMTKGVYGIPVPAGTEVLLPDTAIIPMNGFDEQGYRLGYGGGYFDRTLAALDRGVLAIGVSFEELRVPTIYPQPHDIAMDFVVTEAGIYRAGGRALAPLEAVEAAAQVKTLLEVRGLPRRHHPQLAAAAETPEARGYASPPCYAGELSPEYFGTVPRWSREELLELLNTLLEAERAGAKVLAAFLSEYERDTAAWRQLAAVQRDEAKNCAILIDLIRRVNGKPSTATGDFLGKALAVTGRTARLQFLNRGQKWVARRISDALPYVEYDFVRDALSSMQESHLLNIEACEALVETLEAQGICSRAS